MGHIGCCVSKCLFLCGYLVPAEGFEPPTYGLQNRCTTTVLSRRINELCRVNCSARILPQTWRVRFPVAGGPEFPYTFGRCADGIDLNRPN
jgi:hypothetical protein